MRFLTIAILVDVLSHALLVSWLLLFFPKARRYKRGIAIFVILLAVVPWIARFENRRHSNPVLVWVHAVGMMEQMVVVFGALPMAVFVGVRAVGRRVRRLGSARSAEALTPQPPLPEAGEGEERVSRREATTKIAGAVTWGMTAPVLGWGLVRGRHAFVVEEVVVKIAKLPRTLDGYTIAQVSDLHTGTFVDERELREGFSLVTAMKPDLIVATGDLVDFDAAYMDVFIRMFSDLSSRDGKAVIVGNHDYYAGVNDVVRYLRAAKLDLLMNESRIIRPKDRGGIALLGVDDLWAHPDLDLALAGIRDEAPKVLLAHQPLFFDWAAGRVDLQLSGHTHGGQVNPGFRPADLVMRYVSGRYERKGSSLWVNRGFGVAAVPARVGAPPEITKIILVAG